MSNHPMIFRCCHLNDHGAELNEVRNEKVDDVDRSNMITSHLKDNISESQQAVLGGGNNISVEHLYQYSP